MKFGHFCLPTYFPDQDGSQQDYVTRFIDLLVESEAHNFDAVWANEHHFHPFGGMLPSPPIMLAALAQRTTRVRLGTSVVVLPLHNPIELAEQLAMVDLMSGGRLDLGFGRGYVVHDYEVHGVPYDTAQAQTLEALDVILKAWTGEPFTHAGRFYQYPKPLAVWPQPMQRPHPPIWQASSADPQNFAYAGAHGYNLLTVAYLRPLAKLAEIIDVYRDARAKAGYGPHDTEICAHYQVVVAEDGAEARSLARDALNRYLGIAAEARGQAQAIRAQQLASRAEEGVDVDTLIAEGRILVGTPDEVAATLQVAQETLGMSVVDCNFYFGGMPYEAARRSLQLFGDEVIPHFKRPATQPALAATT